MKSAFLSILATCLFAAATNGETTCNFTNWEAGENAVSAQGLQFTLSDDAWCPIPDDPDAMGTIAYDVDINLADDAACFPEQHALDVFTILNCGSNVESGVWGVITHTESAVTLGAAYAGPISAGNSIEFDFTGSGLVLNAYESYTLHFVSSNLTLTELGISIGSVYDYTSDSLLIHSAAITEFEEEGETWTNQYDSNDYLSYISADSGTLAALAPAVSISTTQAIPEPTTATLSLLVLCGLALRRRR